MPDWHSWRIMADIERHDCTDRCVCPIHGTPMWYAAATEQHACQDPACEHAAGVDLDRLRYEAILATETFRRIVPPELRHEFWPTGAQP